MFVAHLLVCFKTNPMPLFASIPHDIRSKWYVFLHSDDENIRDLVLRECNARSGQVYDYRENRGLARSWNEGMHAALEDGCQFVMLLNDDLFFLEDGYTSFRKQLTEFETRRDVSYITVNGLESGESQQRGQVVPQNFACCAILRHTVEQVGYFDENLTPAYFEDIDYDRRCFFSHLRPTCLQETLVEHKRSSTISLSSEIEKSQIRKAFRLNQAYFVRKWGDNHQLEKPFGSSDFGSFISYDNRTNPYGLSFDRNVSEHDMNITLEDIGFEEGTDKSKLEHDFLGFYERELVRYKDMPLLLLEVGVSQGGSLRMWSRFFDKGTVVGLDIEPTAVNKVNRANAHVRIGDASRLEVLDKTIIEFGQPTIVIDDGSHQWHHMIETLRYLWPRVKSGGAYIVEDLHTSFPDLKKEYQGYSEMSPYDYLLELNKWVVGNRFMSTSKPVDGFVANYWPTIESMHWYRGTCVLFKK